MRELTASQYQVLHAKGAQLPHNTDNRPAWRSGQSPILVGFMQRPAIKSEEMSAPGHQY